MSKEYIDNIDISFADIEPLTFRILNLILNLFLYLSHKILDLTNENKFKANEINCKRKIEINLSFISKL